MSSLTQYVIAVEAKYNTFLPLVIIYMTLIHVKTNTNALFFKKKNLKLFAFQSWSRI